MQPLVGGFQVIEESQIYYTRTFRLALFLIYLGSAFLVALLQYGLSWVVLIVALADLY